ncbi:MAG TPA: hypothetical protein DHN33_03305 [Eubacteriaceae bacterium]|nr:hypothetical protein [Eubacteriaceae bacterium]
MLHLVTDSACDLPDEIIEKYNIHVVSLQIDIEGELYLESINNDTPRCPKRTVLGYNLFE